MSGRKSVNFLGHVLIQTRFLLYKIFPNPKRLSKFVHFWVYATTIANLSRVLPLLLNLFLFFLLRLTIKLRNWGIDGIHLVIKSKASDYHFNQVVSMDLKEIKKGQLWILHMEDAAKCYTAAAIIHNKRKETIVKTIFQIWLAYFGAPHMFHSDCRREFNNDMFRDMNNLFNIETSTTLGESSFSNGKVERANKLLFETM